MPDLTLDRLPELVLVLDDVLAVRGLNRAADDFGWRGETLRGRRLLDLLPSLSSRALEAAVGAGKVETRWRRQDGVELAVDVRFARLGTDKTLASVREVPDRVGMEADLQKATLFLDAIVENIPDMIFVKDAETLLFERFNRAGEELLGWKRSELLGKTDHDFYPKEQADFFHQKDRETLRNKKLVDIAEEPIETKTKGRRWLHTKKVPVLDEQGVPKYLLGISEDITARKEAEEARRIAEERAHAFERELAQVVLNAGEAIVTWTADHRVQSWNPGAEKLYGLSSAEALGKSALTLMPESLHAGLKEREKKLLRGERLPLAATVRMRGTAEVEVEESFFAITDAAGQKRFASIARDVTELALLRRAAEILGAAPAASEPSESSLSAAMRAALEAVDLVAQDARSTVLLLGETGVGKGWFARRIHERSPRAEKPYFELNCATMSGQLVESELFGHERGAFTGAVGQKHGIVEVAAGGSLFLDEIAELPLPVQAQLLTFLDQRTFRRVGGTRTLQADCRVLAATNADLKAACERGTFRRDLYFRLTVVPITVPPLRERREEIPALARALLNELSHSGKTKKQVLSRSVMRALQGYAWPGNVRELRNALERALILSRGEPIGLEHLAPEIRGEVTAAASSDLLSDIERRHIMRVLDEAKGNRTRAAELLGLSRSTLKRKLAEYK
jgi:PAS domain S-box-containing protein